MAATDDLDRRLDVIERQLVALANSLRTALARIDKIEDELETGIRDLTVDDQGTLL